MDIGYIKLSKITGPTVQLRKTKPPLLAVQVHELPPLAVIGGTLPSSDRYIASLLFSRRRDLSSDLLQENRGYNTIGSYSHLIYSGASIFSIARTIKQCCFA